MLSYTKSGTTTAYQYNADGIRTTKTVGSTTTKYFLNGSTILAQQTGSNTIPFYYDANGKRIAFKYNGEMYYYVYNLQGDVTHIMKSDKTIAGTYQYDAWGKILNLNSLTAIAKVNPFRYRGYYYDTESNLYYLNSRYYNPGWGRFINADGLVSTGQDILGFNMFTYCSNNPIMFSDPSGTMRALVNLLNKVMPAVSKIYRVANKPDNFGAAFGLMSDILSGTIDIALEVSKCLIGSSSRPNNIGVGAYKKYISAQMSSITKAQSHLSSAFNVLSYAFVVIDASESAYFEYQMGFSTGKIVWDFSVDILYDSVGVLVATAAGAALGNAIPVPILGAIAGAALGFGVGQLYEWLITDFKNKQKELVW